MATRPFERQILESTHQIGSKRVQFDRIDIVGQAGSGTDLKLGKNPRQRCRVRAGILDPGVVDDPAQVGIHGKDLANVFLREPLLLGEKSTRPPPFQQKFPEGPGPAQMSPDPIPVPYDIRLKRSSRDPRLPANAMRPDRRATGFESALGAWTAPRPASNTSFPSPTTGRDPCSSRWFAAMGCGPIGTRGSA